MTTRLRPSRLALNKAAFLGDPADVSLQALVLLGLGDAETDGEWRYGPACDEDQQLLDPVESFGRVVRGSVGNKITNSSPP